MTRKNLQRKISSLSRKRRELEYKMMRLENADHGIVDQIVASQQYEELGKEIEALKRHQ